ncbi:MAG: O-antigen ligase family protein [Jannaschia helgolandensis]|jgi:exopolysaccharide production protein ExoQ|uniref:Exopolysaccharide production protein ExoQ n=1 Tax=Jannaschia helgolandensis TaxID=188906 RepID=A0A1H7SAE7_9RHOB|nr:O-antigen ligase family protein [Jannaschia helgolandensis]SEL69463.1 exopolysaccharide production protein ExoQ [Jannaschia helgolandensis]
MSSIRADRPGTGIDVITVEPDVVLLVIALFGLVFIPALETYGALIFLTGGCALLVRRIQIVLNLCIRYWYLMALPIFCLLSAVWSQYPAISFRFGVQLTATVLIAIAMASTTSARAFSRALFGVFSLAMLTSILFGDVRSDTGAWLGIYGSKNALAGEAATYVIVCTSQILDRTASNGHRLMAVLGLMIGAMLLLLAQSTGALIVVPPALFLLFSLLLIYRLSVVQRLVAMTFAVLLAAMMALLVTIYADALLDLLLETTGKDVTLTGRTDLWRIARELIAERPFFGIGYQAFWVKGYAPAEVLWYNFAIESRSGFNFHNTYLSNAVEIGVLGVFLQVVVLYGAALATGLWALRTRLAEASLLFVLVAMIVMLSFVEVNVFFQFSLRTVIVICAFVYATRGLDAHRRGT